MARYNSKHEGDKNATKVTIVPGRVYNLTQEIGANCSGIRPAWREMKKDHLLAYRDLLNANVAELNALIDDIDW